MFISKQKRRSQKIGNAHMYNVCISQNGNGVECGGDGVGCGGDGVGCGGDGNGRGGDESLVWGRSQCREQ